MVLLDHPMASLSRGQVAPVPYLLGINSLEFSWGLPFVSKKKGVHTIVGGKGFPWVVQSTRMNPRDSLEIPQCLEPPDPLCNEVNQE